MSMNTGICNLTPIYVWMSIAMTKGFGKAKLNTKSFDEPVIHIIDNITEQVHITEQKIALYDGYFQLINLVITR